MRLARLIGPELETLLRESPGELRELLDEIHPEDIADVVEEFPDDRAAELLTELPTEYAAQVFERLPEERQKELAARMGTDSAALIATEMDADERADFFSALPPAIGAELLESLEKVDPEAAEDVEELTRWPETSAGGLMTTDFISVPPHLRVADVIEEIRRRAQEAEAIDAIYVVDDQWRLRGYVTLRSLLLADAQERVADILYENVISVPPEMDQEEVARTISKYDLNVIPVVDDKNVLLGVITADDILDVVHEEQAEDVQKMGGIEPIQKGYFDATFGEYIRKRAPWLLVLFVGGFFTTSAMQHFNHVLSAIVELAFYVPLLIAAGGNSGSQSSTLVIRGIAVGEISSADWHRVVRRELAQGVVLGAMLAVFGVMRVVLSGHSLEFALLVAVTIVAIVVMGCLVGAVMPLLLSRLGIDPATSSGPFITTLVDVLGILIYLGLARWLFADLLARAAGTG
jgi:magnesium transporter